MKGKPAKLIFVCGAMAELSWLYAWASFLIYAPFGQLYPLPQTLGVFSLAVVLTFFCRGRGWRVIQIIAVYLAALALTGLWVVKGFYYPLEPWLNQAWMSDFFTRSRDQVEWFLLVFVSGYTIIFWAAGTRYALQVKSYISACSRFDRGVVAFFCLFLVKLTFQTRMGVQFHDSIALMLIVPFFIFSLMEIGLARSRRNNQTTSYLSGYHAVGVLATFTLGALISGIAVFMFFLPYLKSASGVGYDLMKRAVRPFGPILTDVVRFIFGYSKNEGPALDLTLPTGSSGTAEVGTWIEVLMWGGWILMAAIGLAMGGMALWYAIRWLFKKRDGGQQVGHPWRLLSWLKSLKTFLSNCFQWMWRAAVKRSALEFYVALLHWGRNSGLASKPGETPLEYGQRLSHHFPKIKNEIMLIIDMLHWEVYGESALKPHQIDRIKKAWKKLHSPLKWPFRLKFLVNPSMR